MRPTQLFISVLSAGLLLSLGACSPATQYDRGVDMTYHPSAKADAQQRIVDSAVELRTEADEKTVKDDGGLYLGELEVVAAKSSGLSSGSGGKSLSGRVSLEAAGRGATHFYLASSNVEHTVQPASGPHVGVGGFGSGSAEQVARTHVRFVLYRVEPDAWTKLPKELQPTLAASAQPAAPGSAASAQPGAPSADVSAKPQG